MKNRGFTLIEIIVVMAVIGILLGVGVPSLVDTVVNNRNKATAEALLAELGKCRVSSLHQNQRCLVVFRTALLDRCVGQDFKIDTDTGKFSCQGLPTATVVATGSSTTLSPVVFNARGEVVLSPGADALYYYFKHAVGCEGDYRCYRVEVTPVGNSSMCQTNNTGGCV